MNMIFTVYVSAQSKYKSIGLLCISLYKNSQHPDSMVVFIEVLFCYSLEALAEQLKELQKSLCKDMSQVGE